MKKIYVIKKKSKKKEKESEKMIYKIASISSRIAECNEWLENKIGSHIGNAAFGTIALVALFAFGCWLVSYLNKR